VVFHECATTLPQYSTDLLTSGGAGWQATWTGSGRLDGAELTADGRAYVLLGPDHDNATPVTIALASGTASGAWSNSAAITTLANIEPAIAIDADGAPHALYAQAGASAGRVSIHDGNATSDRALLELDGAAGSLYGTTTGALGAAHDAVVAVSLGTTPPTLHVLAPSSAGYVDIVVPQMTAAALAQCPDTTAPSVDPSFCRNGTTCTLTGDVNGAVGVATTADGSVWLAVLVRHVDEDVSYTTPTGPTCAARIVADRSAQALVLRRVLLGAVPELGPASKLPLPTLDLFELAVAASGPRLYFNLLDIVSSGAGKYVVVDTAMLP
jgi:hypothetical protein